MGQTSLENLNQDFIDACKRYKTLIQDPQNVFPQELYWGIAPVTPGHLHPYQNYTFRLNFTDRGLLALRPTIDKWGNGKQGRGGPADKPYVDVSYGSRDRYQGLALMTAGAYPESKVKALVLDQGVYLTAPDTFYLNAEIFLKALAQEDTLLERSRRKRFGCFRSLIGSRS